MEFGLYMIYTNVYISFQLQSYTGVIYYSEACLNHTSLGPACVFRIDRCSVDTC